MRFMGRELDGIQDGRRQLDRRWKLSSSDMIAIAGQEEREPDALRCVPDVELAQRAALKRVLVGHGDGHHVAFFAHGIETQSYPRNAAPALNRRP